MHVIHQLDKVLDIDPFDVQLDLDRFGNPAKAFDEIAKEAWEWIAACNPDTIVQPVKVTEVLWEICVVTPKGAWPGGNSVQKDTLMMVGEDMHLCKHCDIYVMDKGLVMPFDLDGTPHMACFDKRFAIRQA